MSIAIGRDEHLRHGAQDARARDDLDPAARVRLGSVLSTLLGLLVFPAFTAAVLLTLLDRVFGTSFYQANLGGNNFAVRAAVLVHGPSRGVRDRAAVDRRRSARSSPCFTRKPLFGYRLVVGGMVGIFVLSLVVWMHHIYWSGANTPLDRRRCSTPS